MKTIVALVALVAFVVLVGCGEPHDARTSTTARPASPRTVPPAKVASTPTQPPAPRADLAGFAPTEVLAVTFKEINDRGYPIVTLENLTGRDIDDIRGAFRLHDSDGTILHSTGLTIAVPGDLFIAAGGVEDSNPFGLNRREELMRRLATSPAELSFSFEAHDVTFMDSQAAVTETP